MHQAAKNKAHPLGIRYCIAAEMKICKKKKKKKKKEIDLVDSWYPTLVLPR
jgi:hypothetical protein